jgi:hypothetical protein
LNKILINLKIYKNFFNYYLKFILKIIEKKLWHFLELFLFKKICYYFNTNFLPNLLLVDGDHIQPQRVLIIWSFMKKYFFMWLNQNILRSLDL